MPCLPLTFTATTAGTFAPAMYHTAMQRARIEHADLTDTDKRLILRDNAVRVFGLKLLAESECQSEDS